jgi:hypothetical protein
VEYATGRGKEQLSHSWISSIQSSFESHGFRFRALLHDVAMSSELYSTGMAKPAMQLVRLEQPAAAK